MLERRKKNDEKHEPERQGNRKVCARGRERESQMACAGVKCTSNENERKERGDEIKFLRGQKKSLQDVEDR